MEVNLVWRDLLAHLIEFGDYESPRNQATREILAFQTTIPMNRSVVTVPSRKLGYRFLAAESAWILSGDNRLSSIAPFAKRIAETSDDGLTFRGAYGPPFVDQVGWVAAKLREDPATRQALMTIWRPRPGASLDCPCTVSLQWFWRNCRLYCSAYMRSSDAWLGWVYDVHTFSMMSLYLLLTIRNLPARLDGIDDPTQWAITRLGDLHLTAGSQHIYERDLPGVAACLQDVTPGVPYASLNEIEFTHPDQLTDHLWRIARRKPTDRRWLTDLIPGSITPTE